MRGSGIDDRTRARIAALPPFADQAPESWKLEPLGGMTNRNVKLSRDGESYVVRLAGRGPSDTSTASGRPTTPASPLPSASARRFSSSIPRAERW